MGVKSFFVLLGFFAAITTSSNAFSSVSVCSNPCSLNLEGDAFLLKFKRTKCKDQRDYKTIELPSEYTVLCNSCRYTSLGSENARLKVFFPDFLPVQNKDDSKLDDMQILIYISSNCGSTQGHQHELATHVDYFIEEKEQSLRLLKRLERTYARKDVNGNDVYDSPKKIGNQFFMIKAIQETNSAHDYYYRQIKDGGIETLFACRSGWCMNEKNLIIKNGAYSVHYRFQGIDPIHYPNLDQQVMDFVQKLYDQSP